MSYSTILTDNSKCNYAKWNKKSDSIISENFTWCEFRIIWKPTEHWKPELQYKPMLQYCHLMDVIFNNRLNGQNSIEQTVIWAEHHYSVVGEAQIIKGLQNFSHLSIHIWYRCKVVLSDLQLKDEGKAYLILQEMRFEVLFSRTKLKW